ncbi:7-keto-8-aminopelargonate synthetase-like enzyme [Bradyrhizobium sp. RT6a]
MPRGRSRAVLRGADRALPRRSLFRKSSSADNGAATTCLSLSLWFTPVLVKRRELAEPLSESAPIRTRRLSRARVATGAAGGAGQVWIVVESLYSMDSDLAPLEDLLTIADRHDAFLVVGEVHASGVCSEQGRGLTAPYEGRTNLLVVHRCGKALGAAGALVTASGVLRDFLIKCCCPFIFATAPSPLMALAVREALLILEKEAERQQRLAKLVAFTHLEMVARGEGSPSNSQILPYFVAENARAMRLSSAPHARGFDIRGMRPQTVPASTACLRSLLTLNVGEHEGRAMLDALTVETMGGSR